MFFVNKDVHEFKDVIEFWSYFCSAIKRKIVSKNISHRGCFAGMILETRLSLIRKFVNEIVYRKL